MSIISSFYRYCFIHIPKNAGTTISWNLTHYYAGFHRKEKHDPYSKVSIQYPEIRDYFTFAFVRNPFVRLVSWWNYLNTCPKKQRPVHDRIRIFLKENPTFSHFIHALEKSKKGKDSFFYFQKLQFDYLSLNGEVAVDFVGKVKNIDIDWKKICNQFDWDSQQLPRKKKNTIQVKDYEGYFDRELTKIVIFHFKKDFEAFGYKEDKF